MLIEEKFILEDCRFPQDFDAQMCQELKYCNNAAEIISREPKKVGDYFVCTAPMEVVNDYIKEKFGTFSIYGFIATFMYIAFEEMAVLPIAAPNIVCVLRKESFSKRLIKQFSYELDSGCQDDSIFVVTLVECEFSLLEYHTSLPGIWHETKDFRYLIDGASQSELIVFFERKNS